MEAAPSTLLGLQQKLAQAMGKESTLMKFSLITGLDALITQMDEQWLESFCLGWQLSKISFMRH